MIHFVLNFYEKSIIKHLLYSFHLFFWGLSGDCPIFPWNIIYLKESKFRKKQQKIEPRKDSLKENPLTPTLDVKVEKTIHKVLLKDILFIENQRNNIRIKLAKTELIVRHNSSTMENLVPKDAFIRVHRSCIINHGTVSSFSPTKIEIDDVSILVGRKYKDVIKEVLEYN